MSLSPIRMHNKFKNGFSLVEIVLGMALFAILIVTVNAILFGSLKSARKSAAINKVREEGAYALGIISRDIQFSDSLVSGCGSNTLVIRRHDAASTVVTYTYVAASKTIQQNGNALTSSAVALSIHPDCPQIFTCNTNFVTVCFGGDNSTVVDVTDQASGSNGIKFYNQVLRQNGL